MNYLKNEKRRSPFKILGTRYSQVTKLQKETKQFYLKKNNREQVI